MSLKVIHCRDNSKHHVLAAATTGFKEFLSRNGGTAGSRQSPGYIQLR
jgi:hypothetical protein